MNPIDDEKSLRPTPTESRAPSIRFDAEAKDGSPIISRKCSQLIEKPSGPEYRVDEKTDSSFTSLSPANTKTSSSIVTTSIAGPRFTILSWIGLGRWQKWLTVLGCFMLMFNSFGLCNAYGTYQSYYKQHLLPNQNAASLNLIGSLQCFIILSLSMVVGRVLDAGHFYRLHITGAILVTLASFLLSLRAITISYAYVLLVQGVLMSLGMACMFVPSSQIVAGWFHKWVPLAMGVVASGASIGGLIYPLMLKHLLAANGFHKAQRFVSILTAVTCVIGASLAVPNPDRVIRVPKRWTNFRTFVDPECFKRRSSLGLIVAICLLFTGFYAVFFNLEDWAADTGLGRKDQVPDSEDITLAHEVKYDAIRTFWLLSIMNGCSTLGRVGILYIGNLIGALRTHATVTFIAAMLLLALWTTAMNMPAGLTFVVLFGIISGAEISLPPGSMADILGKEPEEKAKLGQWTGTMYGCASPFALFGPVLGGLLIQVNGLGYLPLQLWCGIALLLSAAAMGIASLYHYPKITMWSREMV